jgi:hypothetical protein
MTVIYSLDAYRTVYVHPSRAHAYTITIGPGSKQAKTCQNRPSSTYVSTRFLSRAPKCDGALTPTFRCALRNARSRSLSARSLKCPIAYVNEYRCGCVHVVYIHIGVSHIIVFLCFDFHATGVCESYRYTVISRNDEVAVRYFGNDTLHGFHDDSSY